MKGYQDLSWLLIAITKNGAVIADYSPGWVDFGIEFYWEDTFETCPPDLPIGMYQWSGYTLGYWDEDSPMNVTGGVFEPYAPIARQ